MSLLLDRPDVAVHHAAHADLAALLPRRDDGTVCDLLCVDAPYSERTHAGHDGGIRHDGSGVIVAATSTDGRSLGPREVTRPIEYAAWSAADVAGFVATWAPLTSGWIVSLTDTVHAPRWIAAMEAAGRYAFAPLPLVEIGSRVRLLGDGPCSWTCWVVVARPRSREWLQHRAGRRAAYGAHCTLPGAYVVTGRGDRQVIGGKRSDVMESIVRDYSEPGDVVCDPCCGAGTALIAALRSGRTAIGGDSLREHAEMAARRLDELVQRPLFV